MRFIKKGIIRLLCIAFAIVMLLTSVVSCVSKEPADPGDDTTTLNSASDAPTPIKADFGGHEYKVLSRGSGGWQSNDIVGDISGTSVDQAVYQRNATLARKYNFEIIEKKDAKCVETAKRLATAGQHDYDTWAFSMGEMAALGQEGFLYNLYDVKGLNLSAPYYDQNTIEDASFAHYLFVLTGDMITQDDMATNATLVNMSIFNDLNLADKYGDIYDVVLNGRWSFEKLQTYAKAATWDSDGDGQMTKNDNWAGSAQKGHISNFMIGFGNDVLRKNPETDILEFNSSEKLISNLQEILTFLEGPEHYYRWATGFENDHFGDGKQLFWYATLHDIVAMRKSGIKMYIIPNPKYNEEQADYYTYVPVGLSNCITIASTVKKENLDVVANIIELISYESMNTVTPALIEYLTGGRIIDNQKDADTIQLILRTRTYAYNDFWSTGGIMSSLGALFDNESTDVVSVFDAGKEAVIASVQRKLERLNALG